MATVTGSRQSTAVRLPRVVSVRTVGGEQHVTLDQPVNGVAEWILPRGVPVAVGEEMPRSFAYRPASGMPVLEDRHTAGRRRYGMLMNLTAGGLSAEDRIVQARSLYAKDSIDVAEFERIVGEALGLGS